MVTVPMVPWPHIGRQPDDLDEQDGDVAIVARRRIEDRARHHVVAARLEHQRLADPVVVGEEIEPPLAHGRALEQRAAARRPGAPDCRRCGRRGRRRCGRTWRQNPSRPTHPDAPTPAETCRKAGKCRREAVIPPGHSPHLCDHCIVGARKHGASGYEPWIDLNLNNDIAAYETAQRAVDGVPSAPSRARWFGKEVADRAVGLVRGAVASN